MDEADARAAIADWFRAGAALFGKRPDDPDHLELRRLQAFIRIANLLESDEEINDLDLKYLVGWVTDGQFRPSQDLEQRLTVSSPPPVVRDATEQANVDCDFIADVLGPLRPL